MAATEVYAIVGLAFKAFVAILVIAGFLIAFKSMP